MELSLADEVTALAALATHCRETRGQLSSLVPGSPTANVVVSELDTATDLMRRISADMRQRTTIAGSVPK